MTKCAENLAQNAGSQMQWPHCYLGKPVDVHIQRPLSHLLWLPNSKVKPDYTSSVDIPMPCLNKIVYFITSF